MRAALLFALCFWFSLSLSWRIFGQDPKDRPPIIEESREADYMAGYVWYQLQGTRDQVGLWHKNRQVGIYHFKTGFYHTVEDGRPGPIATAPIPPPFGKGAAAGEPTLFGVSGTKRGDRDRVWNDDGEYTLAYISNLLEADLRDDSRSGHLTAIARDASRKKQMEKDWERTAQQTPSAAKVRFQAYEAEHPVNKLILAPFQLERDDRYRQSGIALLAQQAEDPRDGKAKVRAWYDYRGPETMVEGLRAIDPNYQPNAPLSPLAPWKIDLGDVGWLIAAGCILGLLVLIAASFR